MINVKTIYEIYYAYLLEKKEGLKTEIKEQEVEIERVKTILLKYVDKLEDIFPIHLLLAGKIKEIPINKVNTQEYRYINIQVKLYYNLFVVLALKKNELERIDTEVISYDIVQFIITRFNDELIDEIIYNRYIFEQPSFGKIYTKVYDNKKRKIDWGQSNKNKETIISQGKKPYYKEEAEEYQKESKIYDGVQWLTYHENNTYLYMYWDCYAVKANTKVPNIVNYNYIPNRSKYSVVRKLINHRNKLSPEQLDLYKR